MAVLKISCVFRSASVLDLSVCMGVPFLINFKNWLWMFLCFSEHWCVCWETMNPISMTQYRKKSCTRNWIRKVARTSWICLDVSWVIYICLNEFSLIPVFGWQITPIDAGSVSRRSSTYNFLFIIVEICGENPPKKAFMRNCDSWKIVSFLINIQAARINNYWKSFLYLIISYRPILFMAKDNSTANDLSYLCWKLITSENLLFVVNIVLQFHNFFISWEVIFHSWDIQYFYILNHSINFESWGIMSTVKPL